MTRSDREDENLHTGTVVHELLPETDVIEWLRASTPADQPAIRELRRRHLPATVDYARLYTTSAPTGEQLADEAFLHAMREVCDGVDPSGTWRHHVLTHVRETALAWAADSRREHLRPDFLTWAQTAGPSAVSETPNVMIAAFCQLPERLRAALWYAVVDDESPSSVATHLGTTPGSVPVLTAKALVAMRDAYLKEHLSRRGTPDCRGFSRITDAAAQARDAYRHPDLAAHLVGCADCGVLLSSLAKLYGNPQTLLAEGLLVWGGAAYTGRAAAHGIDDASPPGHSPALADGRKPRLDTVALTGDPLKDPARPVPAYQSVPGRRTIRAVSGIAAVIAVAAVAVNDAVPEISDLSGPERSQPSRSAGLAPPTAPSRSAGTPSGAATAAPGPTPPVPVRTGETSQIVHAATGLCLDVENQVVQKRVNAVAAPCSSGATQRWTFDTDGHLHNMADPAFCLKVDDEAAGVGIRPCASDDPEKRARMTFDIGENGAIRSQPRPDQVVVPINSSAGEELPLVIKKSSAEDSERWAARPVGPA
ncbi:ricin-type beta-trefoil lectin domain protein [Streptomyces sp. SCSIO 30461]|uniref:ricin-type beta-trefoil lectin domain protein n=1 Tax=Streptomyces sp. SCSIO 30461 TaxID=3118085 RepID=UPI0030CF5256